MSKQKVLRAVLIAIITLVLLYAGYYLIGRQTVGKPLQEELEKVPGVKHVTIVKSNRGKPNLVQLKLSPVRDLALLYRRVDEITKNRLDNYLIEISGNEDTEAQQLFYQLSLVFFQGIDNGNYVAMQKEMTRLAGLKGWNTEVQMDETNAYLVMYRGDKYWYKVMNRSPVIREEEAGS